MESANLVTGGIAQIGKIEFAIATFTHAGRIFASCAALTPRTQKVTFALIALWHTNVVSSLINDVT